MRILLTLSLAPFHKIILYLGVGLPYDPRANARSTFTRNIFDRAEIKGNHNPQNATMPGIWHGNVLGYVDPSGGLNQTRSSTSSTLLPATTAFDIRAELRDPYHHDFRACPGECSKATATFHANPSHKLTRLPSHISRESFSQFDDFRACSGSHAAHLSAGAYPVWTVNDTEYWIPGRRERVVASTPVPPTGSIGVHLNTDLMFLPARLALSHSVYFGKAGSALTWLMDLHGVAANIAQLPALLEPSTRYVWRVDTHVPSGVEVGIEWALRTGSGDCSCKITPHPPPQPGPDPPPTPGPSQCPKECAKDCPDLAGKGKPCADCVMEHSEALHAAGCWPPGLPSGGRHAFIAAFCDGSA